MAGVQRRSSRADSRSGVVFLSAPGHHNRSSPASAEAYARCDTWRGLWPYSRACSSRKPAAVRGSFSAHFASPSTRSAGVCPSDDGDAPASRCWRDASIRARWARRRAFARSARAWRSRAASAWRWECVARNSACARVAAAGSECPMSCQWSADDALRGSDAVSPHEAGGSRQVASNGQWVHVVPLRKARCALGRSGRG